MPVEPLPTPVRGSEGEHALELEGGEFSEQLASTLARSFAKVTLLATPQEAAAAGDRHWVNAARAAGADMMLECSMRYDKGFVGRRNDKFWLNLPLFLLGGPACYFVNDRTYSTNAELIGDFFDLSLVYRELYELGSGRVRLLSVNSDFDQVSMDFKDRAGSHVPSYAFSLFIPAGLLARSNERVKHGLERKIQSGLTEEFGSRVGGRRRDFVEAEGLVNFWFEPASNGAVLVDADTALVRGKVVLRIDEEVRRMSGWRICSGEELETHKEWEPFGEPVATTRSYPTGEVSFLEYSLEATQRLSPELAAAGPRTVRLEIEDGHENRHTRRYTFRVDTPDGSAPEGAGGKR